MGELAFVEECSAQEKVDIFVFGDNLLINEVMCYFLTCKMGFSCIKGSLEKLKTFVREEELAIRRVILIDFDILNNLSKESAELKELVATMGEVPVIIFNFSPTERIKKWVSMGIRGFLYNFDPSANMLKAVKMVMEGKVWIPRQAFSLSMSELTEPRLPDQNQLFRLTKREREILSRVAAGNTNSDIAEKLFISPHTVKVHIQNIFKKIGVPNRVKATIWANHHDMDVSC